MRRAWAGALLATALAVPFTSSASNLPSCSRPGAFTRVGDWIGAKAPHFVERAGGAGQDVTTYNVDPLTPKRMFVTNGTSIEKSLDGGCTWIEVFSLPETPDDTIPFAASTTRLTELRTAEDAKYRDALFVVAQESTEAGGRPHLLYARSAKRGKFVVHDSGLPPTGRGHDLVVGVANSDFCYLAVDTVDVQAGVGTATAPLGGLYASTDATGTWTRRTPLTAQASYDALALDPGSGNQLWAVEQGHLRHSTDGGRTFAGAAPTDSEQTAKGWQFTALAIVRPIRQGPVVQAYSASSSGGRPVAVTLTDGGTNVHEEPAPGPVETAASGYDASTALVSTRAVDGRPARIHLRTAAGVWSDITPTRTTQDLQVSTDRTGQPQVRAITARSVLTYGKQVVPPPPGLPPPGALVPDPGLPQPVGPPSVLPASTTLSLGPAESRDVTYVASLQHRNVPLDLYFLVDASESMKEELPGVRADALSLVDELRAAGVDVWAGLGWFRTTCEAPAYRRELAVGPTDDPGRLAGALDQLTARAPGLETQLFALDQSVTGSGAAFVPPPDPSCGVPAGLPATSVAAHQEAGFREAALKVVLPITDITFRRAYTCTGTVPCNGRALTPTKPDGTIDLTPAAQDFLQQGVRAIGIAAAEGDGTPDLSAFAALTHTLAPPGGADCDGDGRPDLAAGAPLVCRTTAHLAPTLRAMLSQVALARSLQADVVTASSVLRRVVTLGPRTVDVTKDVHAPVVATFSCRAVPSGTYRAAFAVRAVGGAVDEPLGHVLATITCLPPPLAAPRAAAPPAAVTPPVTGTAPAPAPPAAAPAPQPQTQVQTQAQVQTQVQAGAQEQEEVSLALSTAGLRADDEPNVELVLRARQPAVPQPVFLSVLAAMTAGAGGLALRLQDNDRTRAIPQQAR